MKAKIYDQFFTTPDIAKQSLLFLKDYIPKNFTWIEPSIGKGVFLQKAQELEFPAPIFFGDIDPENWIEGISLGNFLEKDLSFLKKNSSLPLVCIGNPPFGNNSSTAIQFFNHASQFSDFIAMIFPATFCKQSIQKRLNPYFHLIGQIHFGKIDFLFENSYKKVPVVFQIWEKKLTKRLFSIPNLDYEQYFEFVSKEKAYFAIQRVGVAAGKLKTNFSSVAESSHYFISLKKENYLATFQAIDWNCVKYFTAGNPSISKKEIIELFMNQLTKS
jgi:hypothetical protein